MVQPKADQADTDLRKFGSLAALSGETLAAFDQLRSSRKTAPPRRDLIGSSPQPSTPLLILTGWAFRWRLLVDGRRQIIRFLLPGDLILPPSPEIASPSITSTLTQVETLTLVPMASAEGQAEVAQLIASHQAIEAVGMDRQVTRLGRMDALERIIDWILETADRLDKAGLVRDRAFALPVTQEIIGDVLGLTSVHVNRTIKLMRELGLVEITRGQAMILDRARSEQACQVR